MRGRSGSQYLIADDLVTARRGRPLGRFVEGTAVRRLAISDLFRMRGVDRLSVADATLRLGAARNSTGHVQENWASQENKALKRSTASGWIARTDSRSGASVASSSSAGAPSGVPTSPRTGR